MFLGYLNLLRLFCLFIPSAYIRVVSTACLEGVVLASASFGRSLETVAK